MSAKKSIELTCIDGDLYVGDTILLAWYLDGDCDTIVWPNPNVDHLRSALFDLRESDEIPNVGKAILPDGSEFEF